MIYKCPVCNSKLYLEGNTYKCDNNHSFDISKKGYVNLLLANQSHSKNPGDSKEMVEARTRFLNSNHYLFLKNKLIETIDSLTQENSTFCDLACGEGYYTQDIHKKIKQKNCQSYGVDLSKYAIIEAGRKKRIECEKDLFYSIGNLLNLPYMDNSFDIVLNCFAPMFEKEFHRILKKQGFFIRVLPNVNHMFELKSLLYKIPRQNELKEETIKGFNKCKEIKIQEKRTLYQQEIENLFKMTPLFYKSNIDSLEKIKNINNLDITFDFIINIYQKED